jgi:DNA-binding MarR family transcriptional regulator
MPRDQLIQAYMLMRDPTLEASLEIGNGWNADALQAIRDNITENEVKLADAIMDFYQQYYEPTNAVYTEIFGVDMPQNPYYSPAPRDVTGNINSSLLTLKDNFTYASALQFHHPWERNNSFRSGHAGPIPAEKPQTSRGRGSMTPDKTDNQEQEPISGIDKLIHEPSRFTIMAHLYVGESADFLFLMRQNGLTWGNLSSHLSKLETAGYVAVKKEFLGKKPHTLLNITDEGRVAFQEYRQNMKQVLDELPDL